MTLVFEKLETVEMLENRVNGAQGGTAKGIRLVAPTTCNQENDQSLRQKAQHGERPALLDASAAVFAHEVGNPLQSIFGTLECGETEFKKRRIVDPLLMSMIEAAIREVDRLRKLLQEFRCLASVQELHLQLADLAKIIEEVLALQRLGYRAAGIDVKLECENPLPSVMLDAAKINQVILNLCKNAVEAMPNGGCLSIRVYPSGTMIVMEIADTGVGVPGGVDVFQLFKTTKAGRQRLGTFHRATDYLGT